jgi:hypothetical protein
MSWDAFICHASEDKENFVRPLANELRNKGLVIWYDEFTLQVGDSLRGSIDKGLAESGYGIVVLSPDFFRKRWPQQELNGLAAREIKERKVILPIWHNISLDEVASYSPMLADRIATRSSDGLPRVVGELLKVIQPELIVYHSPAGELAGSLQDQAWRHPLQPLTKANLIAYEQNMEPGIDWNAFVLGQYDQLRRLFVHTMGQLIEAIEDIHARAELDDIYGRLLGRRADPVGIFAYQPFIFLLGAFGRELVEQAVLASPEYRERKTRLTAGR